MPRGYLFETDSLATMQLESTDQLLEPTQRDLGFATRASPVESTLISPRHLFQGSELQTPSEAELEPDSPPPRGSRSEEANTRPASDSAPAASASAEDWLSAFGLLDEALSDAPRRPRVLRLWSDSSRALSAVDSHVRRRCELMRLPTLISSRFPAEGAVPDLGERLGLFGSSDDRRPSVNQLMERLIPWLASFRGVCLLYVTDQVTDGVLIETLEQTPLPCLVVALSRRPLQAFRPLPHELTGDDLRRWWEALAAHAGQRHHGVGWEQLQTGGTRPFPQGNALQLLAALQLAARPWPRLAIEALGSAEAQGTQEALAQLLEAEAVEVRDGLVEALSREDLSDLADPDRVATALCKVYPRDASAMQRAAELRLSAGSADEAVSSSLAALDACATHRCRATIWQRIVRTLPELGDALATELRLAAAEHCMERGDMTLALRCSDGTGDSARALLVRGRAALGQGDLAGASAAFEQAERFALRERDAYRACVASTLLAEVELSQGHYQEAELRVQALLSNANATIQFSARNVAGKVLLARSEWQLAEKHFAADAADAALAGEHTEVLKARVNRSVALLALGQLALAESELRRVLNESQRLNNPRAAGYALSNLAVLHIDRREYAHALDYLQRALDTHLQVGHRTAFAHDVTNLVELRLRMGQLEEAEQALRFARRALDEPPVTKLCALGLAEARVAFEAGQLLSAKRALTNAKRHAAVAANGDKAAECCRMAVRIALAEGYLEEATSELDEARGRAHSAYARAETAVLTLLLQQASGGASLSAADAAVGLARASGDEELMREAHQAAARVAYTSENRDRALFHIEKAQECQRVVASRLSDPSRFLCRSDHLMLNESAALLRNAELSPALRYPKAEADLVGSSAAALGLEAALAHAHRTPTLVLGERGSGRRYVSWLLHQSLHPRADFLLREGASLGVEELDTLWTGVGTHGARTTLVIAHFDQLSVGSTAHLAKRLASSQPGPWVIATATSDLDACSPELVAALGGQTIRVPALRQRLGDLDVLARRLIQRIARQRREPTAELDERALCLLRSYDWPGNINELEIVLRRASLRSPARIDTHSLLSSSPELNQSGTRVAALRATEAQPSSDVDAPRAAFREIVESGFSLPDVKRNVERECIVLALRQTSGNITRAAQLLGMKRPRLSQLVKQYALVELCSHFAPSAKKAPSNQGRNS